MDKTNKNDDFNITTPLSKKEKILRYASPFKAIIYFSVPTIIIMLASSLYNLADKLMAQLFAAPNLWNNKDIMNWYTSHVDSSPTYDKTIVDLKGYINIATQYSYVIFNIGAAFASLIAVGSSILYSIEYGKRNYKNMNIIFNNALIFSICISIFTSLILFLLTSPHFGSWLITIQEGSESNPVVSELAWNYVKYFLILMPLFAVNFVFMTTLRSQGKTVILIIINFASLLINCLLDFLIIKYGKLDLDGAMIATGISWVFNIIIIIFIMYFEKDKNLRFHWKYFLIIEMKLFKDSSALGLTAFFIKTSNALISILSAIFITKLHDPALIDEKHTYILQQLNSSLMPWILVLLNVSIGISQGVRIIISYSYGANNYQRIKKLTYDVFYILFIWMFLFDLAILFFGPYMAIAFAFPKEFAFKYRWYIFAFNYSYPLFAFTYTAITLFNSIKKSISSAIISLLRSAIILAALSFIGFEIANYVFDKFAISNSGLIYAIFAGSNDIITLLIISPYLILYAKNQKNKWNNLSNNDDEDIKKFEISKNNNCNEILNHENITNTINIDKNDTM